MGIFDIFKKSEKREDTNNADSTSNEVLLSALMGRESIDRNSAESIPVVAASVELISNMFAQVPFKLYKREVDEKGRTRVIEVDDPRVKLVNEEPGDTLDAFQLKKAMCEDYLMGKGGYAYIEKRKNKFIGLYYVSDKKVSFRMNQDPIHKEFTIRVGANNYDSFNFLKFLRNTKNGAYGKGITDEIEQALLTAVKRLTYEYDLTRTGGSRKGFIKSKNKLDEKSIKALKHAWEDYYNGNANTVILNSGMEFQEASNTSQQNEINEKNKTFADDVKLMFQIGNTYDETVRYAINPIAKAFATALDRELLLEKEKGKYYWSPDLTELFKGNLKERYEAYAIAIDKGFKTRNEVRQLEDTNPIDGLDVINLGLGDVLLDAESGEIYTPNTNTTTTLGKGVNENEN